MPTRCNMSLLSLCSSRLLRLMRVMIVMSILLLAGEIYALVARIDHPSFLTFATLAMLLFLCVGLFSVKSLMIRRMLAISGTAEAIIRTGDLSQRIPIDWRWEDLSGLSAMLNTMLEEIERSVGSLRTMSDNIAHDLRTPLTRLRNHIEELRVTATHCPTVEEQQERYRTLVEECDGVLGTFQALLRISNIEAGRRGQTLVPTPISAMVHDVVELYEPLAAEKNIRLLAEIAPDIQLICDRDLLFQAFANLLDNAIKYTPEGGSVAVELVAAQGEQPARFVLRDSGVGIPDAEKERVFQRFYRVAPSRSEPGSGLGLSLVAAIARLHHARITLTDNTPSGLVVTVTF